MIKSTQRLVAHCDVCERECFNTYVIETDDGEFHACDSYDEATKCRHSDILKERLGQGWRPTPAAEQPQGVVVPSDQIEDWIDTLNDGAELAPLVIAELRALLGQHPNNQTNPEPQP